MNPENLILAILVGLGVWVAMRYLPKPRRRARPAAAPADQPEAGTMPRLGQPATITSAQIKALRKNHFPVDMGWSEEEASLVLDALAYLRAACQRLGESDPPLEVQNALLNFILAREDLREHVRAWAVARRGERRQAYLQVGPEDLPEGAADAAVAAEASRLLGAQGRR